jgi:hypothetical protein
MHTTLLLEKLKGIDHLEERGVDNIILERIFTEGDRMGRCGLIHLAQDKDQWRNVVNMVTNLRVP